MARDSFHDFVRELFAGLGEVQIKRMFGGAGGYADGVMFLLLADETIHIKVDAALKAELAGEGAGRSCGFRPKDRARASRSIWAIGACLKLRSTIPTWP